MNLRTKQKWGTYLFLSTFIKYLFYLTDIAEFPENENKALNPPFNIQPILQCKEFFWQGTELVSEKFYSLGLTSSLYSATYFVTRTRIW